MHRPEHALSCSTPTDGSLMRWAELILGDVNEAIWEKHP
jgi:hypothetical protein